MHGFGAVEPEPNEPLVPRRMGAPRLRAHARDGACRAAGTSTCRAPRAKACRRASISPRATTRSGSPASRQLMAERGLVGADEIAAGHALRPAKPVRRTLTPDAMSPRCSIAAARPSGRHPRRPASRSATGCARDHAIRRPTRGCRATCAAMSASSRACMAATCFPIPTRSARARTRNGSTPWCSRRANCGAPDGDPTAKVSVDAWEPYLEPA